MSAGDAFLFPFRWLRDTWAEWRCLARRETGEHEWEVGEADAYCAECGIPGQVLDA